MATTFDERAEHQLEELHSLLKPVLDSAIKNVIGLEVATFPYVPPEYRGAIVATRNRLSNCLKALFEFFTAY